MSDKILRNRAGCMSCGDVIESYHVHDFVTCSCFRNHEDNKGIAVDGGLEYLKRLGNLDGYVEMSEWEGVENLPIDW